jgi:hypothetical protein
MSLSRSSISLVTAGVDCFNAGQRLFNLLRAALFGKVLLDALNHRGEDMPISAGDQWVTDLPVPFGDVKSRGTGVLENQWSSRFARRHKKRSDADGAWCCSCLRP